MSHVIEPSILEKSVDIHAPLPTVYHQWTQFEDFPKFMEGVREVERVDEQRLHWRGTIGNQEREWETTLVEQTPDTRIAWRTAGSPIEGGTVSFNTIYEGTRVTLQMTYDPESLASTEGVEDARSFLSRRIEGNLQRFKEFIEARNEEPGAARVEGQGGQVVSERASSDIDSVRSDQGQT